MTKKQSLKLELNNYAYDILSKEESLFRLVIVSKAICPRHRLRCKNPVCRFYYLHKTTKVQPSWANGKIALYFYKKRDKDELDEAKTLEEEHQFNDSDFYSHLSSSDDGEEEKSADAEDEIKEIEDTNDSDTSSHGEEESNSDDSASSSSSDTSSRSTETSSIAVIELPL